MPLQPHIVLLNPFHVSNIIARKDKVDATCFENITLTGSKVYEDVLRELKVTMYIISWIKGNTYTDNIVSSMRYFSCEFSSLFDLKVFVLAGISRFRDKRTMTNDHGCIWYILNYLSIIHTILLYDVWNYYCTIYPIQLLLLS